MNIQGIYPPNIGWLEIKLNDIEMKHLWNCCEDHRGNKKPFLAGNITNSQSIVDKDNWFFDNVLMKCFKSYGEDFGNLGESFPTSHPHPYFLSSFWANYQKETEFNPLHTHPNSIYSFVIWMKIPTRHEDQKQLEIASDSNSNIISNFQFVYTDVLGNVKSYVYHMSPECEGTMLFFPANLHHQVYPFYNCKEERISLSGNIAMDTSKIY
tara:strand:+ start:1780 stop:2409 length:630 start_codon:yes stop_codon:yes gene_type:complete